MADGVIQLWVMMTGYMEKKKEEEEKKDPGVAIRRDGCSQL